jgi:hypothetical protein
MSSLFGFLSTAMVCLTIMGIAFMVILAMPQSRMREVMKQVMAAMSGPLKTLLLALLQPSKRNGG